MPTSSIPFVREMRFEYGQIQAVSPRIRRVITQNPSPFTYTGTGVYVVGHGEVAVIDPGPRLAGHVENLLEALHGETITHILATHTHRDHSPAAGPLKEATGALICGYGPAPPSRDGELPNMDESHDMDFMPDQELRHQDVISGPDWSLECVFTPGHTSNHMCYALREEKALFTGDHVMGWSTSVVVPPDGNMTTYRHSLSLLLERDDVTYWPTHGPPITDTKPFIRALLAHRERREAQVVECLQGGIETIPQIVEKIYIGLEEALFVAACFSVLAHLEDLERRGIVVCEGSAGGFGSLPPSQIDPP